MTHIFVPVKNQKKFHERGTFSEEIFSRGTGSPLIPVHRLGRVYRSGSDRTKKQNIPKQSFNTDPLYYSIVGTVKIQ